jgi:hypothetical protein
MVAMLDFGRRQFNRYFSLLAIIVGAFFVYVVAVVPWIEGPARQRIVEAQPAQELDFLHFKADLIGWLPSDAWERQPCKQISTPTGHIFFQEYQSHDDGRMVVRPLTIILTQPGGEPGQPPIVLRSPDGATLQLDQPLSLGGETIQLNSARIAGLVTLYRAETKPEGQDDWLIQTSDIQINKLRIQTTEEVAFRFGPHEGRGRPVGTWQLSWLPTRCAHNSRR